MENQRRGAAAECGRILATTFLSLLLPLSFLLLSRLSAARCFSSSSAAAAINDRKISPIFPRSNAATTTLILSLLVLAVAIGAQIRGLIGDNPAPILPERRRLCAAWSLIFLMQIFLILGIRGGGGDAAAELSGLEIGNLIFARRAVFALGMHEITIFWRRSVVAPVVDKAVAGLIRREGFGWVEEVALAAGFGNLWWRRLRGEAEALVVLPWMRAEVVAADAVGLLLYYLTAAIGGVRVVKGLLFAVMWVFGFRSWREKKAVDAAVNFSV